MALEVGIVGLPNSGKTTLFNALTRAGAEITAYASVTDKPNVGMAAIADERLDRLAELVHAKKVTPAQFALAWLLARKPWIVPIPGTSKTDHLIENVGAVNVELTAANLAEIEAEFSRIKVHGGRMNEEQMKVVDQSQ